MVLASIACNATAFIGFSDPIRWSCGLWDEDIKSHIQWFQEGKCASSKAHGGFASKPNFPEDNTLIQQSTIQDDSTFYSMHQSDSIVLAEDSPLSLKQLRTFVKGRPYNGSSLVTPESMPFIVKHGTGIVCASNMKDQDLERLDLPLVDAKEGTTTGVSAKDRTKTVTMLASLDSKPEDLNRPGHIFPLKYREGGVLKRAGYTKASVDLAILAGLSPVGVYVRLLMKLMVPWLDCLIYVNLLKKRN
ncbi:hypothetical protein ZIOFF_005209 [Zingiber officinale]|uniref:3,4-dihydroxy-2-butanone-4-phosphate synthase n=1 Tax=Zingiber officinale TaxID=94328 RepID=A0A8J5M468_ZINOF|nr:hypothetical protein ZIOFF_005209 [Zingiber officinale]